MAEDKHDNHQGPPVDRAAFFAKKRAQGVSSILHGILSDTTFLHLLLRGLLREYWQGIAFLSAFVLGIIALFTAFLEALDMGWRGNAAVGIFLIVGVLVYYVTHRWRT